MGSRNQSSRLVSLSTEHVLHTSSTNALVFAGRTFGMAYRCFRHRDWCVLPILRSRSLEVIVHTCLHPYGRSSCSVNDHREHQGTHGLARPLFADFASVSYPTDRFEDRYARRVGPRTSCRRARRVFSHFRQSLWSHLILTLESFQAAICLIALGRPRA